MEGKGHTGYRGHTDAPTGVLPGNLSLDKGNASSMSSITVGCRGTLHGLVLVRGSLLKQWVLQPEGPGQELRLLYLLILKYF